MVKTTTASHATKAQKATIEEITSQEDFKQFLAMMQVTDEAVDFEALSTDKQREIANLFYLWKDKGSPKAEMPKLKSEGEEIIRKLYREKYQGVWYVWYISETPDGPKYNWKEDIITYRMVDEYDESGKPTGKQVPSKNIQSVQPRFDQEYDAKIGEKLVQDMYKHNAEPICYFKMGNTKVRVADPETEFNVDSKQVVELMRNAPGIRGRRV